MGFLSFIVLLAIAYLVWRVTDQLPDLIFRLSEIQRDVAEIRRRLVEQTPADAGTATPRTPGPGTGTADTASPGTSTPRTASPGTSTPGTAPEGPGTPRGGAPHGGETGADYTRS